MLDFQKRFSKQGWAVLPLRLMIGFGFAAHGYAKLSRGPAGFRFDPACHRVGARVNGMGDFAPGILRRRLHHDRRVCRSSERAADHRDADRDVPYAPLKRIQHG